jgi:hypothetical protein
MLPVMGTAGGVFPSCNANVISCAALLLVACKKQSLASHMPWWATGCLCRLNPQNHIHIQLDPACGDLQQGNHLSPRHTATPTLELSVASFCHKGE